MSILEKKKVNPVEENEYIIIEINGDLKPVEKENLNKKSIFNKFNNEEFWKYLNCPHNKYNEIKGANCNICNFKFYTESGEKTYNSFKPFLTSVMKAYKNHKDLILNPEDIWYLITMKFSSYITKNLDKMKKFISEEDGKKKILVKDYRDLEYLFILMENKVKETILDKELIEILNFDFKTTTQIGKLISSSIILNTFKNYFDYEYEEIFCGIRKVLFKKDSLEDWIKIKEKLERLKKYSDEEFINYINNILIIIDKFIDTYKGNVDRKFWNTIIDINKKNYKSSHPKEISGWILDLYDIKEPIDIDGIKEFTLNIPFDYIDIDKNKIELKIVGGLDGVSNKKGINFDAYEPHSSIIIYNDGKN